MKIDMFMSDDWEAKYYIDNKLNSRRHNIEVYNVYDTLRLIGLKKERSIKWAEIKATAKVAFANKQGSYNEISNLWH